MMCTPRTMAWVMIPAVLGLFVGSILFQVQIDVPAEIQTFNRGGPTGRALIVYHPGLSPFQEEVTYALVEGMIEGGWTCDVTTAHRGAPTDVRDYDVLVLGSPTYAWRPATPMRRFVSRLEDLREKPTLLVLTAAGTTGGAFDVFRADLETAGGRVLDELVIWQAAPNEELHGISDPLEIARRAGVQMSLP